MNQIKGSGANTISLIPNFFMTDEHSNEVKLNTSSWGGESDTLDQVKAAIQSLDPGDASIGQIERRDFFAAQCRSGFSDAEIAGIVRIHELTSRVSPACRMSQPARRCCRPIHGVRRPEAAPGLFPDSAADARLR